MITQLRSVLKSNAYRVFLWIFLVVLLFGGMSFDSNENKPWVIKVYHQKTSELEFRQKVSQAQKQYDYFKSQGLSWPRTETVEKEVLRHVVTKDLMNHVGKKLHLHVPEMLVHEQLQDQLASLPPYFFDEKGQVIESMLAKLIAPKSIQDMERDIEENLQLNALSHLISLGSYVAQFEVNQHFIQDYADKKYSVITIPFSEALDRAHAKKVSDEMLEKYYKKSEHGDLYKTIEKRSGVFWKFDSKNYNIAVSKADIVAYYEKYKQSDFVQSPSEVQIHRIFFDSKHTDAQAQAQVAFEELQKDPSSFAAAAKKIVAAKLEWQGAEKTEFFAKDSKKYNKALVDAAFEQLGQDGDISEIIKTDKGYEIIQRIARKATKYKSLNDAQATIEAKLLEEKFAKRFMQDAQRVISGAAYNQQAVHAFIEKRNGRKELINGESKKTGVINSYLYQTEQGKFAVFMMEKEGVILECTQVEKQVLQPFESIKSKVKADYYHKQAEQELQVIASEMVKKAATMSFEKIAAEYDMHMQTLKVENKHGHMDIPALLRKSEIAQKINNLHSVGAVVDIMSASEGYIIKLDEIAATDEKMLQDKKAQITAVLINKAKYANRNSLIASLYEHATLIDKKIEIKEQLFKDIKDTIL